MNPMCDLFYWIISCFKKIFFSFYRHNEGSIAIEAAFVLPVLVVLYFGIVDVTQLVSAKGRVSKFADTVLDLVAQSDGQITKDDISSIFSVRTTFFANAPVENVGMTIQTYYRDSSNKILLRWKRSEGTACSSIASSSAVSSLFSPTSSSNSASVSDVIVLDVCAQKQMITKQIIGTGPLVLEERTFRVPRYGPTLECLTCTP